MINLLIPLLPKYVHFIPTWFRNSDVIFELISLFTSILIFLIAHKIYRYIKNKDFLWFSFSFLMFTLAILSKIASHIIIFYPVIKKLTIGNITIISQYYLFENIFYIIGINLYMLFMLVGAFILLNTIYKSKEKLHYVFYTYLIIIVVVFSNIIYRYLLFHISLILVFLIISYFYLKKYLIKNKNTNKKRKVITSINKNIKNKYDSKKILLLPTCAFLSLSISYTIPILFKPCFYVFSFSELFQLIGFTLILITYLRVKLK